MKTGGFTGNSFLRPRWPAPASVNSLFTLRGGGHSAGPYASFNLGDHVGDRDESVRRNRELLLGEAGLERVCWLHQVHGTGVVEADARTAVQEADAVWTSTPGLGCAIQVADCLAVLIASPDGSRVGAAHAGWRGLCQGVVPALMRAMELHEKDAVVWLSPAIGQAAFEVGPEVVEAFSHSSSFAGVPIELAFTRGSGDSWHADLAGLAQLQLRALGCSSVFGNSTCTYEHEGTFFSYRRDGVTGRMAALIWISRLA